MIWLVVSRTSTREGLALVAIQSRVLVSSLARDSWFFWFSLSLLPKTTAMGVMSISEARLITCDVLRDSLEETRKTKVRIRLVAKAWIGSKKRARAKRRMSKRKKKGEFSWPVEKMTSKIRLKKMVVVISGSFLVRK